MSFWFKFLSIIGEIGLFLLMGSSLVGTYIQYYVFKKTMGLYPLDEELNMKLEEAKQVRDELNDLIDKNKTIETINEDEGTKVLKDRETKLEQGGKKNV